MITLVSFHRFIGLLLASCLASSTASSNWRTIAAPIGADRFMPLTQSEALSLRPLVARHGRLRIAAVTMLRYFRARTRHDRAADMGLHTFAHVVPVVIAYFAASTLPGIGMAAAVAGPGESREALIDRLAQSLNRLGDVSDLNFTPQEQRLLRGIQEGERDPRRIATGAGVSSGRLTALLRGIALKVEREEGRRGRVLEVPFEKRPVADLRLTWHVELRLRDAGIETIGDLLTRSAEELTGIRRIGVGSLKQIQDRLWQEGRRTLRNPTAAHDTPSRTDGGTALLLPPLVLSDLFPGHSVIPSDPTDALGLCLFGVLAFRVLRDNRVHGRHQRLFDCAA